MSTITLTDITVHTTATSRAEGWVTILSDQAPAIIAHCSEQPDNWAQSIQLLCKNTAIGSEQEYIEVKNLLLQVTDDGSYLILHAELPRYPVQMSYARPAHESVYMELPHHHQAILSTDFLLVVCFIVAALSALKWLFEKYILPRF